MTRKAEMKLIDKLIKEHAHDTYLGMWLEDNREFIVKCMRADLPLDAVHLFYTDKP